jgi:hypothetical protein
MKNGLLHCVACVVFACSFFLFHIRCSNDLAGGLETTNGITVVSINKEINGNTVPKTQIILCDTSYLPPQYETYLSCTTYADNNGAYLLESLPEGTYNLLARFEDSNGAIVKNIPVAPVGSEIFKDSVAFTALSSIEGTVTNGSHSQPNALIYIRGIPVWDSTNSTGMYKLSAIPAGLFKIEAVYKSGRPPVPSIYIGESGSVLLGNQTSIVTIDMDLHLSQ